MFSTFDEARYSFIFHIKIDELKPDKNQVFFKDLYNKAYKRELTIQYLQTHQKYIPKF